MQWTGGPNKGFSRAGADKLYLPVDTESGAPSVEAQEKTPLSLLNTVKALIRLRRSEPDLQGLPNLEILHSQGLPFAYRRGPFIIAVNPGESPVSARIEGNGANIYRIGDVRLEKGLCEMGGQSFGIWRG
jgi:maltose alpha-D-glucosyltransferase/alpha-amylase